MTLKGHGKSVWKLTHGFQFSPGKIVPISLKQARWVKIWNFMGFICLKGTLVEPLHMSFTLWHWRAMESLGENWLLVSNSTRENCANFVPASQKVEISNFMGLFCLKGTLVQPKTVVGVSPCDTEEPWKVWGKTNSRFLIQLKKKNVAICWSGHDGSKFQNSSVGFV